MPKIVIIGGGSFSWGPLFIRDLGIAPELAGSQIVLHDIDPQALDLVEANLIRPEVRSRLEAIEYDPCIAVMSVVDGDPGLSDGHLAPDGGPIAWIADNHAKGVS